MRPKDLLITIFHIAMKPDDIKRRSKKCRSNDYYGEWEQRQIVKARELKMTIERITIL